MKIYTLRQFPLVYLATPYSLYPAGLDAAAHEAARIAGGLMRAGVAVYSPIAHSHAIAAAAGIDPTDHDIWMQLDAPMMALASALCVARMAGHAESRGVAHEIAVFREAAKPIIYLDPDAIA